MHAPTPFVQGAKSGNVSAGTLREVLRVGQPAQPVHA